LIRCFTRKKAPAPRIIASATEPVTIPEIPPASNPSSSKKGVE